MSSILVPLEEYEKLAFENKVGKGNMAKTLRGYINSFSGDSFDADEKILNRKFMQISKAKEQTDKDYNELKAKLDNIQAKREAEQITALEEQKKIEENKKMMGYETIKMNLRHMPL